MPAGSLACGQTLPWVDCEKVTGIYWEDPEHETPPNKCVLLADKALRDLETIMRQHPVAGVGQ